VLTQPLYRCNASSPILSLLDSSHGITSIRGNGTWGGHGGSSLNAIGGTLRLGELMPNSSPPTHALKLELFAHQYYFGQPSGATRNTCYRWPALVCDGYALDCTGSAGAYCYNGTNPLLTPGALLAIPLANLSAVSATLSTEPGRMLAWTLANYGGYLVDDTYDDRATMCVEYGFEEQFQSAWGFPFDAQQTGPGSAWSQDVFTVFRALYIVANNGPSSIGGGGKPVQPIAPPPCPV
jgi:hypothetical protein